MKDMMIKSRRYLHQYSEPNDEEFETQKYIMKKLDIPY